MRDAARARVLERPVKGDAVVHDVTTAQPLRLPPPWLAVSTVVAVLAVVVALARPADDQTTVAVPVTRAPEATEVPHTTVPAPPVTNGWVALDADRSDGSDIFLVRPGEDARRIEVAGSDADDEACPAWSPDGTRLSFGRLTGSEGTTRSVAELVFVPIDRDGAAGAPKVMPLDGFHVLDGFAPYPCAIWASDGGWVAFAGGGEVWVVDTHFGSVRRLSDLRPSDLEWRPGTDQLAIAGDMGPNRAAPTVSTPVVVYSASTGELRQLGSVEAAHLTWSPDGSTLAYQGGEDDESTLWLVDAGGVDERVLVADPGEANHGIGPVWSPTGDRIVYQRLIGGGERHEVVLVNVADGAEVVISPPETDGPDGPVRWYPYDVTWSPDGTMLLYSAWSQADPGESTLPNGLVAVPADTPTEVTVLADSDPAHRRLQPSLGPDPDVGPAAGNQTGHRGPGRRTDHHLACPRRPRRWRAGQGRQRRRDDPVHGHQVNAPLTYAGPCPRRSRDRQPRRHRDARWRQRRRRRSPGDDHPGGSRREPARDPLRQHPVVRGSAYQLVRRARRVRADLRRRRVLQ